MFLPQLSVEQKSSFFQLATHLISIDKHIDEREKAMLDMVLLELQITPPVITKNISVMNECKIFTTPTSQRICFLELCCLVAADDVYHEKEQAFLQELASGFAMDAEYVARCLSYAETLIMLIKTGQRLVTID